MNIISLGRYSFFEVGSNVVEACSRCQGAGHYSFDGISSICYRCNGGKSDPGAGTIPREEAEKLVARRERASERRAAKKEAKRLAVVAERDERVAAMRTSHPNELELLEAVYAETMRASSIVVSFADQVLNARGHPLSDKQLEVLSRIIREDAAKVAAQNPAIEGRIEITGLILSIKEVEDFYSFHGGTVSKAVIEDERGFRVYGTVPAAIRDEARRGSKVRLTATIKRSDDDESFGFYSRPSKATILAQVL